MLHAPLALAAPANRRINGNILPVNQNKCELEGLTLMAG
jgi:hypothetical protein